MAEYVSRTSHHGTIVWGSGDSFKGPRPLYRAILIDSGEHSAFSEFVPLNLGGVLGCFDISGHHFQQWTR